MNQSRAVALVEAAVAVRKITNDKNNMMMATLRMTSHHDGPQHDAGSFFEVYSAALHSVS